MMFDTSNKGLLPWLQAGVGKLFDVTKTDLKDSSETEGRFSLHIASDISSLQQTLADLGPFSNLFNISLEFQVQHGTGSAVLNRNGLRLLDWNEDPDLNPPGLSPSATTLYHAFSQQLSQADVEIQAAAFTQNLAQLVEVEAEVDLSLRFFLNKEKIVQSFDLPKHVRILFYVSAAKFLQQLKSLSLQEAWALLIPNREDILVIMLGDTLGMAMGPNIRILGRDCWTSSAHWPLQNDETNHRTINHTLSFRDAESFWEIHRPNLTPYHLNIENHSLACPHILATLTQLRESLAAAYLAERIQVVNDTVRCQFAGQKRAWITLPGPASDSGTKAYIFNLFSWAYENSSSDKLNIVRQIISLQLEEQNPANYSILMKRSADMLGAAKSNFQIFLRRGVELYFDKRLKVSEFIQKFSQEMGSSVSSLTSDLISNLYKTIGIILGVVIAVLVRPEKSSNIIYWAALLYLIYIGFIIVYLLPATYLKFGNKVNEYQHNLTELRDVLSTDEISRLQGNTFQRAQALFLIYFTVTNLLYALLGLTAFILMWLYRSIAVN